MRDSAWRPCSSWGALLALLIAHMFAPPCVAQRAAYEELQIFSGVLRHIQLNYVDSVSYSDLVPAAIRGMLRALDPHSAFVSREEWQKQNALERGELAVTGVALEDVDGVPTVLAVMRKSPAAKAGVLPGDRVVQVQDTAVVGLDAKAVELRLAGERGSKIRVQFERGPRLEPEAFVVTLKRERLTPRSVSIARMADSLTAYVRLEAFGPDAAKEVRDALRRMRGRRQAILDLRGNPGGMVISAVEVAADFLPKETVVFRTVSRKRDVDTVFTTKRHGEYRDIPLVVLIDERSASASEALAGSLQDHDRALIVGRRSFGKALMQTVFFVPSGDNIWLTIGRVVTPSGRFIQRRYRGIGVEQYLSLAGGTGSGEDTTREYRTAGGRVVRGGYGIAPDITVPVRVALPVWWSHAADSAFDEAVADSVAHTIGSSVSDRAAWLNAAAEWQDRLLPPFLQRVRERFGVPARTDTALDGRIARMLAARVADVRWGPDAHEEFLVRNDRDVRTALDQFPHLDQLLHPR